MERCKNAKIVYQAECENGTEVEKKKFFKDFRASYEAMLVHMSYAGEDHRRCRQAKYKKYTKDYCHAQKGVPYKTKNLRDKKMKPLPYPSSKAMFEELKKGIIEAYFDNDKLENMLCGDTTNPVEHYHTSNTAAADKAQAIAPKKYNAYCSTSLCMYNVGEKQTITDKMDKLGLKIGPNQVKALDARFLKRQKQQAYQKTEQAMNNRKRRQHEYHNRDEDKASYDSCNKY